MSSGSRMQVPQTHEAKNQLSKAIKSLRGRMWNMTSGRVAMNAAKLASWNAELEEMQAALSQAFASLGRKTGGIAQLDDATAAHDQSKADFGKGLALLQTAFDGMNAANADVVAVANSQLASLEDDFDEGSMNVWYGCEGVSPPPVAPVSVPG